MKWFDYVLTLMCMLILEVDKMHDYNYKCPFLHVLRIFMDDFQTWYIFALAHIFYIFLEVEVPIVEVAALWLKAWIDSLLALVSPHGSRTRVILSSFLLYVLF